MGRLRVDGVEGAMIPADDPAILRGLSIFETIRTYGKRPFRLEQHLDRLRLSAEVTGLQLPKREVLIREIEAVVDDDVCIRLTITGGGRFIVQSFPIDKEKIGRPVKVAFIEHEPSPYLPGSVKHSSRAGWVLAARELGVEEVIFTDREGQVLEANRSNVIVVRNGQVFTPPLDGRILDGVTRSALFEAAVLVGLEMTASTIVLEEGYDELYLSSSLKELAPVIFHDQEWGGPVGALLFRGLRDVLPYAGI